MSDADSLKEEIIDLQENQSCETKFRATSLSHFCCDQLVAYPGLAKAELQSNDHSISNYLPVQEGILDNPLNQDNCPKPSSWRPVTHHEYGSDKHDATI